jgi:plastocyanin
MSQQYATADQVAKNRAEAEQLVAAQRGVNAEQAQTNAKVQGQIESLKPREVTLPAGTTVTVRTTSEVSTNMSTGAGFDATLESDLKAGGMVVAPARSRVTGYIVNADKGGRVKGTANLVVALRSIVGVKGTVINVTTDQYTAGAQSTKGKDVKRTGIATGVGAAIGGIAGGGSGAAIGAGIGAAAGVGTNMATRGAAAVIPPEELLEFHLASPVTVVIQP